MLVSSEASAVPASSRALIRLVWRAAGGQNVDQRALADLQPEQIAQRVPQPRQRNALNRAQIDHQGAQVVAERRARRQIGRRGGLEAAGAAGAHAAVQRDARHVGLGLRNLDALVGLARDLRHARHVGAAGLAAVGEDRAFDGRVRMQRAMRARMGLGLALGRRRFGSFLTLRWRNARIVRRLGRQAEPGLEFRNPRRERGDLRHQRADQRVLLRMRETRNVGSGGHDRNDSGSPPKRQTLDTP
jgi:hypothetical protein